MTVLSVLRLMGASFELHGLTMAQLKTDWVVIATSGKTIDGRDIDPVWLTDAAECYNREEYTALIWPYHESSYYRSFTYNFGEVDEVKTENKDGKVQLLARLIPNRFLQEANKSGQKLFTSVEIFEDYLGTGKFFMKGLAVTDTPASAGTTRLQFSDNKQGSRFCSVEELTFTTLPDEDAKKGFFERMFSFCKTPDHNDDETPMTKEQFEQLMGGIGKLSERIDQVEKNFSEKPAETVAVPDSPAPTAGTASQAFVFTEEMSNALTTSITALTERMDGVDKKFSELNLDATPLPGNAPRAADTINLV